MPSVLAANTVFFSIRGWAFADWRENARAKTVSITSLMHLFMAL
jgi:hypothetical protein